MKRNLLLLLAIGLLAAACGMGADEPSADEDAVIAQDCVDSETDCIDTVTVDANDLPVQDLPEAPLGAGGGAAGTCLEGTGDCNDTPGTLEPLPVDDGATSGMVPVEGGLTVAEALDADPDTVVAVKGFIVANDAGVFLCEALAESFPPQCGGAELAVEGLAIDEYPVEEEQSTRWTNETVILFGEVADGVLYVEHTVSG